MPLCLSSPPTPTPLLSPPPLSRPHLGVETIFESVALFCPSRAAGFVCLPLSCSLFSTFFSSCESKEILGAWCPKGLNRCGRAAGGAHFFGAPPTPAPCAREREQREEGHREPSEKHPERERACLFCGGCNIPAQICLSAPPFLILFCTLESDTHVYHTTTHTQHHTRTHTTPSSSSPTQHTHTRPPPLLYFTGCCCVGRPIWPPLPSYPADGQQPAGPKRGLLKMESPLSLRLLCVCVRCAARI